MSQIYRGKLYDEQVFAFFFVLTNVQLLAKHFSVLWCYFMKREDSVEKRWNLKLTFNFEGESKYTASTYLKMASKDGYFLYEDDFDAVITITSSLTSLL